MNSIRLIMDSIDNEVNSNCGWNSLCCKIIGLNRKNIVLTARLSSEVARILEYLERLSATSAILNKQSAKK